MNALTRAEFRKTVQKHLEQYYTDISRRIDSGSLRPPHEAACLFPSMVVFTDTANHHVFELFGARKRFHDLKSKQHSGKSLNLLLGGFDYDGPTSYIFAFESRKDSQKDQARQPSIFQNLALLPERNLAALDERFPGIRKLFKTSVTASIGNACLKAISVSSLEGELIIANCLLTNSLGQVVRGRYTNLLLAVPKDRDISILKKCLDEHVSLTGVMTDTIALTTGVINDLPGVQVVDRGDQESVALAGQFGNMYLQGIRETTMTRFLEDNSELITQAFKAERLFFQPYLKWREGNPDPAEEAIQPDLIMQRTDGTWYIIDFKLPLLGKESLTTGGHRRRRFISSVSDGIAQLANYVQYFTYGANRELASWVLKGCEVNEPNTMLVVGNDENIDLAEVGEAMRALRPVDIVDYDTLTRLFLKRSSE